MQYYQRSKLFQNDNDQLVIRVVHRNDNSIPGVIPAQDIWVFAEDPARDPDRLYMTIKNPCKPYRPTY